MNRLKDGTIVGRKTYPYGVGQPQYFYINQSKPTPMEPLKVTTSLFLSDSMFKVLCQNTVSNLLNFFINIIHKCFNIVVSTYCLGYITTGFYNEVVQTQWSRFCTVNQCSSAHSKAETFFWSPCSYLQLLDNLQVKFIFYLQ